MRLIISLVFFFLFSCATQKVEVMQQENCYQYKTFPEFHRCSEKVVKSSFNYKFSFERDIIDQYFAFGEVLALQVEKKTKDNIQNYILVKLQNQDNIINNLNKSLDYQNRKYYYTLGAFFMVLLYQIFL